VSQIPIQNIYYLLSYAWNRLDEADLVDVGDEEFDDVANLLGKVLASGCSYLFKKGIYRNYHEVEEEISGVRGRLMIGKSVKDLSFQNKRAWCRYDELTHNVLPNQILKATILRLLQMEEIDEDLHEELKVIHSRFSDIRDINLQLHHFNKVHIHRNNAFYRFLLQVCQLIFESSALQEEGEQYQFRDFSRDDSKMRLLFQAFVKNFYIKEQDRFDVYSPKINWSFKS
jgi:5-methylcytosine-specific restriction enzyme subunit McrC